MSARKSMTVQFYTQSIAKRAEALALVNSRATENFLNLSYARWLKLPIKHLNQPQKLYNHLLSSYHHHPPSGAGVLPSFQDIDDTLLISPPPPSSLFSVPKVTMLGTRFDLASPSRELSLATHPTLLADFAMLTPSTTPWSITWHHH